MKVYEKLSGDGLYAVQLTEAEVVLLQKALIALTADGQLGCRADAMRSRLYELRQMTHLVTSTEEPRRIADILAEQFGVDE